jgi:hypothetical protein
MPPRIVPPPPTRFPASPAAQLKKPNRERERQKQLRKAMHVGVQVNDLPTNRMRATAQRGNKTVTAHSGDNAPEDTYITDNPDHAWPWNGKPQMVTPPRDHQLCAEAHVYAKIVMSGENPKKYDLISYNAAGVVAPPCANCKTWVGGAFASVRKLGATYRPGSTQAPHG